MRKFFRLAYDGNGLAMPEGAGARPERQRSHVRIVSGAPEKRVPSVPGLWRLNFPRGRGV